MQKIKINGVRLIEEVEVQQGVFGAFRNLLTDMKDWHLSILGIDFARLDGLVATRLEDIFIAEKIFATQIDMNGDKAICLHHFIVAF